MQHAHRGYTQRGVKMHCVTLHGIAMHGEGMPGMDMHSKQKLPQINIKIRKFGKLLINCW
jgi:hypothetical protein